MCHCLIGNASTGHPKLCMHRIERDTSELCDDSTDFRSQIKHRSLIVMHSGVSRSAMGRSACCQCTLQCLMYHSTSSSESPPPPAPALGLFSQPHDTSMLHQKRRLAARGSPDAALDGSPCYGQGASDKSPCGGQDYAPSLLVPIFG